MEDESLKTEAAVRIADEVSEMDQIENNANIKCIPTVMQKVMTRVQKESTPETTQEVIDKLEEMTED